MLISPKYQKKRVPQFRLKVCCQEITKIQKYWNREKCTRVLMCHQRNVLHCCEPILPKYQTNFIGHSLLQKIVENTPFCWWFFLPILQKMADNIFGEYERNISAFSVYFYDYNNLYFGLKPRFQRQNIISENSHHCMIISSSLSLPSLI